MTIQNKNNTRIDYQKNYVEEFEIPGLTMSQSLKQMSEKRPNSSALRYYGKTISQEDLQNLIDQCKRALINFGIKEGDVVSICLPNIPSAVIAYYAINSLGCIANMIHPLSPAKLVAKHIDETTSSFLFITDIAVPKMQDLIQHINKKQNFKKVIVCKMTDFTPWYMKAIMTILLRKNLPNKKELRDTLSWNDFINSADGKKIEDRKRHRSYEEACAYLHSGGTTAEPKTIMLSDYNFNAIAYQGKQIMGFPLYGPPPLNKSMITVLPLFHGFGLCMGMHTCLINGVEVQLLPQFSPKAIARLIKKERSNYLCGVPTLFEGLMQSSDLENSDLSCLEEVFCGGDSLSPELKSKFDNFLAQHGSTAKLREGYGLTETVTVCSVMPGHESHRNGIGKPLANIKMKIIDSESRKELSANQLGEICVHGPSNMLGYLNDPESTSHAMVKHDDGLTWIETGDIGIKDAEGFYHFKGRLKRVLKVSGVPVFPKEIEELISQIDGVRYVAAIGIPHPYKMSVVKVFVVPKKGINTDHLRQEILSTCRASLINHAVPREIEFRDKLPLTLVGKVDVKILEQEERLKRNK